jgi:hypothetical protein
MVFVGTWSGGMACRWNTASARGSEHAPQRGSETRHGPSVRQALDLGDHEGRDARLARRRACVSAWKMKGLLPRWGPGIGEGCV